MIISNMKYLHMITWMYNLYIGFGVIISNMKYLHMITWMSNLYIGFG